jgi:hypothetical protein
VQDLTHEIGTPMLPLFGPDQFTEQVTRHLTWPWIISAHPFWLRHRIMTVIRKSIRYFVVKTKFRSANPD